MGRPPKYSKEDREAQGNPGRRPQDVADASYEADGTPEEFADTLTEYPEPPDWLVSESDQSALAQQAFRSITEALVEARILRESDLPTIARYCRYLADWVDCTLEIDRIGIVVTGPKGTQRNPAFLARQQLEKDIVAIEKELGLTARSRLVVQRALMASLKDLPLAGQRAKDNRHSKGPVGFLEGDE